MNDKKWLSNENFLQKLVARLWGVGEEITFLRNLIKIGRFTFRVQKFNSAFSLVRERDFVIPLISSYSLKTFLSLLFLDP